MEKLHTVEQALEKMLARCHVTCKEALALAEARGAVLAEECVSDIDLPPFNNSAVDGYAVCAMDTAEADALAPARLSLAFQQPAGPSEPMQLARGATARVMTGAPIPHGADAVVMQEDVSMGPEGTVQFVAPVLYGEHVRKMGSDVTAGDIVLPAGTLLGPAELGILAATGRSSIACHRRPRVAIVTTGDEVEEVGALLAFGKIYNSNSFCLRALVDQTGAEPVLVRHIPDDFEATCNALAEIARSGIDAIVCAGGVSVGARDFVKPALERLGSLDLWRVAMKPGKPVAFGSIGETLFFGLPGNPASVLVTFELFVRPCLWKLAGRKELARELVDSTAADAIQHVPGRREYVRAATVWRDGGYVSTTTGAQASGRLRSLVGSNSLIVVPEDCEGIRAGERVRVILTNS